MLNGFIGAMVGGFELACWLVTGVGAVVKAAVGQRPAEPFVKEQEEQGHLDAFCAAAELMVCRLFAGGEWIRTLVPVRQAKLTRSCR